MGRQKTYTDKQEKEIVDLLRKGLKPVEIATKYNVHHSIIRYIKKVNCPDLIIHNKRISDEVKAKALELILNDWLYKDIAVELDISKTTVGDIARKNNIPKKKYQPKVIPVEIRTEFINLVKNGLDVMQASWLMGISDTTGYKICNEYGLSEYLKRRENLTDGEIDEINKLYAEGYSYKSICEKMNISSNTVTIHTSSNRYNEYNDEQITLLCELVFVEKMSIREASEIADIRLRTARSICYKYKKQHNLI